MGEVARGPGVDDQRLALGHVPGELCGRAACDLLAHPQAIAVVSVGGGGPESGQPAGLVVGQVGCCPVCRLLDAVAPCVVGVACAAVGGQLSGRVIGQGLTEDLRQLVVGVVGVGAAGATPTASPVPLFVRVPGS